MDESNMKGISRIDSGSTHGWFVRGYKNGETYSKLFSDQKNGGQERALERARLYRDSLHAKLAAVPTERRNRGATSNTPGSQISRLMREVEADRLKRETASRAAS